MVMPVGGDRHGDGHVGLGVGIEGHDVGICWSNALSSNSCQNWVWFCLRVVAVGALVRLEDGSKLRIVF